MSSSLDEIRCAKEWVDQQSPTVEALGQRLAEIEIAFRTRAGEFASVPRDASSRVMSAVQQAADEPGQALLSDVRCAKSA